MKPKKSNGPQSYTRKQGEQLDVMAPFDASDRPKKRSLSEIGKSKSLTISTKAHTCSGCNKLIKREKYLLSACDRFWHESCLKCDQCHAKLGELGSSLFVKSDLILCRQDFLDLFGPSCVCAVCEKVIRASEMVMRAKHNVYHLECFACQLCNQRFCVGDQFYLLENKVICQYDYEDIQRSMTSDQMTTTSPQREPNLVSDTVAPSESSSDHFRNDDRQQGESTSILRELKATATTNKHGNPSAQVEEDDGTEMDESEEDTEMEDGLERGPQLEPAADENDEPAILEAHRKAVHLGATASVADLTREAYKGAPISD